VQILPVTSALRRQRLGTARGTRRLGSQGPDALAEDRPGIPALRIVLTSQELRPTARDDFHPPTALVAYLPFGKLHRAFGRLARVRQIQHVGTLGIARATQEAARIADAELKRLATCGAGARTHALVKAIPQGARHCFRHRTLSRPQFLHKALVEPAEHADIAQPPGGHLVQPALHLCGVAHVHDVGKGVHQGIADDHSEIGGPQAPSVAHDVAAILNDADDGRVGRRPSHAARFQFLDQRRLRIAGRRLGKVLLRQQAGEIHLLPLAERREGRRLFLGLVLALDVDRQVARKDEPLAIGAEKVVSRCRDVYSDRVVDGRLHLACEEAPPDEVVQAVLLLSQETANRVRLPPDRSRADGLVRFLSQHGLRPVGRRLRGQILCTPFVSNVGACLRLRLRSNLWGVGTHVGNEADALPFQVDPLI